MRFYPSILEKVQSGDFFGDSRSIGRVTVEPLWKVEETPPTYGSSERGPFRYFYDPNSPGVEWEVPQVKEISWDRSESQDIASCTIVLSNMRHEGNLQTPELAGQLGSPGAYWPKRGLTSNRWNQVSGKGAHRKDGFWDPTFDWQNVLERYALLRTYEGYGRHSSDSEFISIQDNIDDEEVLITGTWLVESVTGGSGGQLSLVCKDIGKILIDQSCIPPTVPSPVYPVEYYPAGKSPFDSVFGPKPHTGVSPGSQGEVLVTWTDSTAVGDATVSDYGGTKANDGNWTTYALSDAYETPDGGVVWWEFDVLQPISKVSVKAWAGGYDCFLSVKKDGVWLGTESVGGTSFVSRVTIPYALPDNNEPVIHIQIPASIYDTATTVDADEIRITLSHLYYSGIPNASGHQYRGGIRDLIVYREGAKVDPYTPDFETIPWTFAMTQHPTRGYWVADADGNVYGFGDAADYDSTGFGPVPVADALDASGQPCPNNKIIALAAAKDGKGYYALDRIGHVYAYGSAVDYGEFLVDWPGDDFWGETGIAAWDIAVTHTGEGYWVCYGGGQLKGFGDATPDDEVMPWSDVALFMNTYVDDKYLIRHQANGVAAHPTKMGCWVTTGSGEVYAFGEAQHLGQLRERVYNPGMADSFRLLKTEATRSIESTKTGNGYWIAFGSGHIAAFGDAMGQGPTYVYPHDESLDVPIDETNIQDWSFFRAIVWDIARDPDGTGFWVLVADGNVGSYNAEFWGSPGYTGLTGYRWHEGNFDGEYSSIMKELLMWSGFTYYTSLDSGDEPDVYGAIESTGIKTDTIISADKFDKRPIIDIIKELCEVVAYRFRITEEGGVEITSPNFWRSGNFDEDGIRIYVDGDSYTRVDPEDPGAEEFIPVVDENIDLLSYSTTLSSESMRSEIIIGTDLPDPKNPTTTGFVRHVPRSGSEEIAPGIPILRGIPRVGMWISQLFTNKEEAELMAELISLTAWFAERSSSVNCVGNPCLTLGTQIKIFERNTSESYIHYISGINSSHDLKTGVWTYTLTTNWLGTADQWVITARPDEVDGDHYVEISERLDRWQQLTGRGLPSGAEGNGAKQPIYDLFGGFGESVHILGDGMWEYSGQFSTSRRRVTDLEVKLLALNGPLGDEAWFEIYDGATLIVNVQLNEITVPTVLPPIGSDSEDMNFTFKIKGHAGSVGNGVVRFDMTCSDLIYPLYAYDTILVVS